MLDEYDDEDGLECDIDDLMLERLGSWMVHIYVYCWSETLSYSIELGI